MNVLYKTFYLISLCLMLSLIVSHPAKANNENASNSHRSHRTKGNLKEHKNHRILLGNMFNAASSSTVIAPTAPKSFLAKTSLKEEILATDDPKRWKEMLDESANKMKLIGRRKEAALTLNNFELIINDPKPLNELEKLNNNTSASLIGDCVVEKTGRRIACVIHTLCFETEKGAVYKDVKGCVIDNDGKVGFKSKVGFFNRLFRKYKTLIRKPIYGEELYVFVQYKG